jgi:hypothetical protein
MAAKIDKVSVVISKGSLEGIYQVELVVHVVTRARSSCPSCPPGLRPLFFRSDRGRLAHPFAGRRPGRIPRRLPQPRLQLSDPLRGPRQLLSRPPQRSLRLSQFRAQRGHQGGQHLIPGTGITTRHTRTLLRPERPHHAIPHDSRTQHI